jgi:hypothetical protein
MVDLPEVKKISMLNLQVLEKLNRLATGMSGGVLEVGPYIGGSTIALCSGHEGRNKHAVIEVGGVNDNPRLPSQDVIADWTANMDRFGQAGRATLFKGWSYETDVLAAAVEHCGPIGLFFFDANGAIAKQMSLTAQYMLPGCILVIDDYEDNTEDERNKAAMVRTWVTRMIDSGAIIESELIGSTWFGTLGAVDAQTFQHFDSMGGHAYLAPAPHPDVARVRVLENGVALGPADAIHETIRKSGGGAYSQWAFPTQTAVVFSASDNTDPNTNGRRYEFVK